MIHGGGNHSSGPEYTDAECMTWHGSISRRLVIWLFHREHNRKEEENQEKEIR
jgi:hypothetical protein